MKETFPMREPIIIPEDNARYSLLLADYVQLMRAARGEPVPTSRRWSSTSATLTPVAAMMGISAGIAATLSRAPKPGRKSRRATKGRPPRGQALFRPCPSVPLPSHFEVPHPN